MSDNSHCLQYSKLRKKKENLQLSEIDILENKVPCIVKAESTSKKPPDFIKDESYTELVLEFASKWIQTALAKSSKKGVGYKRSAASAEWQHHQEFSFIAEI